MERLWYELDENMHTATLQQYDEKMNLMVLQLSWIISNYERVVKGMGVLKLVMTGMKMHYFITMAKIVLIMLLISS